MCFYGTRKNCVFKRVDYRTIKETQVNEKRKIVVNKEKHY